MIVIVAKLIKLFYLHFSLQKSSWTIKWGNLKVIKNTFPNKSDKSNNSWKPWKIIIIFGKKLASICWGRSTSWFVYGFAFQVVCEKTLCSKACTRNLRYLYENNPNYTSYKFSCKVVFITFLSFCRKQKQESNFQQVCDLVMRNIWTFFVYSELRSTLKVCQIQ